MMLQAKGKHYFYMQMKKEKTKLYSDEDLESAENIVPIEIRHMAFIVLSQYINTLTVLALEEVTNYYNFEALGEV